MMSGKGRAKEAGTREHVAFMSRTSVKESHDQNNNCYINLNLVWNQHQWELCTET